MNIKLEIIFFIITLLALLIGIFWMVNTEKRLKRFFLGKKAKDLEDTIVILENEIAKLDKARMKIEQELVVVNSKLKKSIRGVETIRFNPFPDQGSNQSFQTFREEFPFEIPALPEAVTKERDGDWLYMKIPKFGASKKSIKLG